jgi:8-oxo-dGTP pyrophosphatase MutT (NUDIX family)
LTPPLLADARRVLSAWIPPDEREEALRREYLGVLCEADAASRTRAAGHLTASALIVDPYRRRMLLLLHRLVGLWLPMGGHCEASDGKLADVALREASEESGIAALTLLPGPVALDRHPVPCQPTGNSVHLDVAYVAVTEPEAVKTVSAESLDLQWFPLDEPAPEPTDDAVRLLVERARTLLPAAV